MFECEANPLDEPCTHFVATKEATNACAKLPPLLQSTSSASVFRPRISRPRPCLPKTHSRLLPWTYPKLVAIDPVLKSKSSPGTQGDLGEPISRARAQVKSIIQAILTPCCGGIYTIFFRHEIIPNSLKTRFCPCSGHVRPVPCTLPSPSSPPSPANRFQEACARRCR